MTTSLKRLLVGRPIASDHDGDRAIGRPTALAVFASDAISSTAYANEEILFVLLAAGTFPHVHRHLLPMAIVAVLLLAVVAMSYRQTIHAYPDGGGAYVVSRENISPTASLVAAAALLVDYTLTVAVSVSSGVLAIGVAFDFNDRIGLRIGLAVGFVAIMAIANLRGLREAGKVFAVPTYAYTLLLGLLVGYGAYRVGFGGLGPIEGNADIAREFAEKHGADLTKLTGSVGLLLLLRAFSSGAVVLSGVEAMSNGVPAFREPKAKHASQTLLMMAAIMGTLTLGVSFLASRLHPVVDETGQTVLAQLSAAVFGDGTVIFYGLQFATFGILVIAANTAFAGFPQLASIVARDGFLPRQLANRGDRLVFSNGILILAAMAIALIVAFRADVAALIPLYAVGVFIGFTLSQFGMCRHHLRHREPRWRRGLLVNGIGASMTLTVLLVVAISKFTQGAWIPVLVIPAIVIVLRRIHHHYESIGAQLAVPDDAGIERRRNTVIVLVGSINRGSLTALSYARSLDPDHLLALTVVATPEHEERIRLEWASHDLDVELVVLRSPYRELTQPIVGYLDALDEAEGADRFVTVVIPEFTLEHPWHGLLHNQSALILRTRLRHRPGTVVTSVPFHVGVTVPTADVAEPDTAPPADSAPEPDPNSPPDGSATPDGSAAAETDAPG